MVNFIFQLSYILAAGVPIMIVESLNLLSKQVWYHLLECVLNHGELDPTGFVWKVVWIAAEIKL